MLLLQLMVAPLRRLGVNKPTPIEKVGSQDSVLSSIGAFITGKLPATADVCIGISGCSICLILTREPGCPRH